MHEETNSHLIWECWNVQDFWSKIQNILLSSDFEIQLNYFKVSFGVSPYGNIKNTVISFVILSAKHYIFSSKYKQRNPDINRFLLMVKGTRDYEKYIALFKDKIELHDRNWQIFGILCYYL